MARRRKSKNMSRRPSSRRRSRRDASPERRSYSSPDTTITVPEYHDPAHRKLMIGIAVVVGIVLLYLLLSNLQNDRGEAYTRVIERTVKGESPPWTWREIAGISAAVVVCVILPLMILGPFGGDPTKILDSLKQKRFMAEVGAYFRGVDEINPQTGRQTTSGQTNGVDENTSGETNVENDKPLPGGSPPQVTLSSSSTSNVRIEDIKNNISKDEKVLKEIYTEADDADQEIIIGLENSIAKSKKDLDNAIQDHQRKLEEQEQEQLEAAQRIAIMRSKRGTGIAPKMKPNDPSTQPDMEKIGKRWIKRFEVIKQQMETAEVKLNQSKNEESDIRKKEIVTSAQNMFKDALADLEFRKQEEALTKDEKLERIRLLRKYNNRPEFKQVIDNFNENFNTK